MVTICPNLRLGFHWSYFTEETVHANRNNLFPLLYFLLIIYYIFFYKYRDIGIILLSTLLSSVTSIGIFLYILFRLKITMFYLCFRGSEDFISNNNVPFESFKLVWKNFNIMFTSQNGFQPTIMFTLSSFEMIIFTLLNSEIIR